MNPSNPFPPAAPAAPTHPELLIHTLALDVEHFNGPDPLPVRNERLRTRLKARMNELADKLAADITTGKINLPVMLKARLYLAPQVAPQQQAPVVRAPGRPVTTSSHAQRHEAEPAQPAADDFSAPETGRHEAEPAQPAADDEGDEAPSPDPRRTSRQLQPARMRELKRNGKGK
ncbi:MAG: hypothetical protein IT469_01735 [Pseudomonadales bacterium]|nr:hypothetical protein [Pseudomonadales bacterium]